jgi:ABC-type nitrate/sulfonate/bicarbonate transport system substrate-binding protein
MTNPKRYRHRYPGNGARLSGTTGFLLVLWLSCGLSFAQEQKKPATRMQAMQAISTPDFGYLPTYLAKGKNFFADEGLDLKLVVMNARVSVLALLAGEIQFAVGASSMNAALRGSPLKVIFFFYNTSTWQFMVRPEIRNAEDLKGKVVAIGTVGSTTDLATRLIINCNGRGGQVLQQRIISFGNSGVVLSNLAYLADSPGLDFGEKNGKATFRFSSSSTL